MMTLQKINTAAEFTDWLGLAKAQSRVATTMIISSMPYILLRPITSANHPKKSCPIIMPPDVEAFKAWLTEVGSVP